MRPILFDVGMERNKGIPNLVLTSLDRLTEVSR